MEQTEIQMPDPATTKSITFAQYKVILSVHYMGTLSTGSTDAAYLTMLANRKPPACIRAAFRAWRNSSKKPVFANTVKKNEAANSLYEVLQKIGTVTINEICKKSELGKNAARTYLTILIDKKLVTRSWEQQKFFYSVVPQPQENEQVAA